MLPDNMYIAAARGTPLKSAR